MFIDETKPRTCYLCGKDATMSLTFYRSNPDIFPYMPINSIAHMECYIQKVIEEKIKEKEQND